MTNFSNTIQTGVSLIIFMVIGFVCSKLNILNETDFACLNKFISRACFFSLTFRSLVGKDVKDLDWKPFGISVLMVVSVYILSLFIFLLPLNDRFGVYISTVFPTIYINYIITGVPIFLSLWDESDINITTIILLSNDLVASPIFFFLASIRQIFVDNSMLDQQMQKKKKCSCHFLVAILLGLCSNMFLLGVLFGLIYSSILPNKSCIFLDQVNTLLGNTVLPLALLSVGAFLSKQSIIACSWPQFIYCFLSRLFIGPFFALLYCLALKIPAKIARQCIILTAQPTAVASFPMAQSLKLGTGVASSMILWTTLLMVPAILFWLMILDKLNLFVE